MCFYRTRTKHCHQFVGAACILRLQWLWTPLKFSLKCFILVLFFILYLLVFFLWFIFKIGGTPNNAIVWSKEVRFMESIVRLYWSINFFLTSSFSKTCNLPLSLTILSPDHMIPQWQGRYILFLILLPSLYPFVIFSAFKYTLVCKYYLEDFLYEKNIIWEVGGGAFMMLDDEKSDKFSLFYLNILWFVKMKVPFVYTSIFRYYHIFHSQISHKYKNIFQFQIFNLFV